ncbi:Tn3 family transposase [Nocardia sp. NPDC005998]|uniref:Tn3 family transposase n=1 Tax=Nocardia sp. NPDC005998 TaxID=3156894 RepID=UPI0033AA18AF
MKLQQGGGRPEAIITDTGSYSDIKFGLLHLIGKKYRPQLANCPISGCGASTRARTTARDEPLLAAPGPG